jgi:hypothetical protein
MQQAGAEATQNQLVSYRAQKLADLARLVREFADHLDELKLDTRVKQRAKAQLATIEAQLSDDPDPVIVRQAGRTLRAITEGAVGSLIAAAVQPAVWSWVAASMAALF